MKLSCRGSVQPRKESNVYGFDQGGWRLGAVS